MSHTVGSGCANEVGQSRGGLVRGMLTATNNRKREENVTDYDRNKPPETVPVQISRSEVAFLFNLLCDNPRPWNKRLRAELANFTDSRTNMLAKSALLGRANEGDFSPTERQ
jgi:hypothetical protein